MLPCASLRCSVQPPGPSSLSRHGRGAFTCNSCSSLCPSATNVIPTCTTRAYHCAFWWWAIPSLGQCWYNAWCSVPYRISRRHPWGAVHQCCYWPIIEFLPMFIYGTSWLKTSKTAQTSFLLKWLCKILAFLGLLQLYGLVLGSLFHDIFPETVTLC